MSAPVDVLALAARAGMAPGETMNAVFPSTKNSMPRRLTLVEVRHQFGNDWLHWQWDRGENTPWGTADCGFAGHLIDAELIAELEKAALARVKGHAA